MILENGVIRTMDASLPVARALAIAGDRVAGGVGTHETALASPDVVDLGGRCVLPGFTDSHVHFPTWALAQRQVRLEGVSSLGRGARARRGGRTRRRGGWIRAASAGGTRDWATPPTKEALDAVTGDVPAALFAQDYHSLWLNSAALALADGDLDVAGGVVERDDAGEPTGRPARGVGVAVPGGASRRRRRRVRGRDARGAARRRVAAASTAVHDKDGWLGAPGIWQRLAEQEALTLARLAVASRRASRPGSRRSAIRTGLGDDFLRVGYLKAFMDGTLGSQTARMLDGSGVEITSGERARGDRPRAARGRAGRSAVHAIGDLANREALDAFEATRDAWAPLGLRHRIEHAQCLAPEDVRRFAALGVACSVQFSHAPSDRDLAERFWADRLDGAYAFRSLWDSGALVANGSDAPVEELDPLAGIRAGVLPDDRRAARRGIPSRPDGRAGARRDDRQPRLALRRRAAAREAPPRLPRRPRRALARPARVPSRRARDGRGRRDDGRRPLGAQPAAVGLSAYNQLVATRTMLPVHAAPTCSVAGAAEIVGSKWTVLIVHDLSEGPRRFTELERSCAGHQPTDARRAAALARGRGDRRAPELSRSRRRASSTR